MSLDKLRELVGAAKCTPDAPWFTVDSVWLPGPDVPTYVVAGFSDPHIGKPVVDAFMPEDVEDEEEAISEADAIMEFCAKARNAIPDLESLLSRHEALKAAMREKAKEWREHAAKDKAADEKYWTRQLRPDWKAEMDCAAELEALAEDGHE